VILNAINIFSKGIIMADPIDDFSNYQLPVTTDSKKFSATATAASAEVAEDLAKSQVQEAAVSSFGVGTTQYTGFDSVRIKLNDNGTYTATYSSQAIQVEPPPAPDPVPINQPVVPDNINPVFPPPPLTDNALEATLSEREITYLDDEFDPYTSGAGNIDPPKDQKVVDGLDPVYPPPPLTDNSINENTNGSNPIPGARDTTRTQGVNQDIVNFNSRTDWRVRLSLAPKADYLYNVAKEGDILAPLKSTNGVIFPYTPQIQVSYQANYDPTEITHTNYKHYNYRNSEVSQITINADFTAQDTAEANYMLAVIHFFKSVTKMFYGQDKNPTNGTPPPLCYLSGFGAQQFDNHPVAITSFQYNLPNDVDYIRSSSVPQQGGVNLSAYQTKVNNYVPGLSRLFSSGLTPGAATKQPEFSKSLSNSEATYVPTKVQFNIQCIPIVTRADVSRTFSLREYATGSLLRGSKRQGGGIW
jgi:hypothetical protein